MKPRQRIYIIGIDSAPAWIIKELSLKFGLEGFGKFIRDKALADLESTLPPITAAAWPSIYTGLAPGEHGVMNFFTVDRNYTKQLTFYDTDLHPPFWDVAANEGLRCLVVTPAMVTQPSSSRNVDMVTGFPLKPRFSNPRVEKAASRFRFEGEPEIEQDLKDGRITLKDATDAYVRSINARAEFSKHMIKSGRYDMVFVCFTETDRMQHYALGMPGWEDYIGPLYSEISGFLEWLMSECDDGSASFMIASDHGAQPIKRKLLLNSWLISNGYARLSGAPGKGGAGIEVTTIAEDPSDSEGLKDQRYREQLQLTSRQPAIRFICASVVESSVDFASKRSFDMKNTRAFASLSNNPVSNIWVNDERFSMPGIRGRSKSAMLGRLRSGLLGIRDGKERVIERVHTGKSYYKGTKLFIQPDLIIETRKGYTVDVFNHSEEILGVPEAARRGDHTRQGVFGFYSREGKVDCRGISVTDIAPIVLDYCGIGGRSRLRRSSKRNVI